MRFLHAADLHLGLRITRFPKETNNKVREARFTALDNLVKAAVTQQVDFILIAGDLFDDNHIDATTSRRALELLEKTKRPTYVLPGNHDPLTVDSVWEREPWKSLDGSPVRVLRASETVDLGGGATLWPCPLVGKNSVDDPTRWIPARAGGDRSVRIGVAHGSIKVRPDLPEDDHLIDHQVVEQKGLSYLALGHWHGALMLGKPGAVRAAYPGTHETMRFQGAADSAVGWTAYSNAPRDLFADDGRGMALLVALDSTEVAPRVEPIEVGHLHWREEAYQIRDETELGKLIDELAVRPQCERQLLRLRLEGVLSAKARLRLDELENADGSGVLHRYLWAELNADKLLAEPTEGELRELAGDAILRRVYEELANQARTENPDERRLAQQALAVLYRLARECRA